MIELNRENTDMTQFEASENTDVFSGLIIHETGRGFRLATNEEILQYEKEENLSKSLNILDKELPDDWVNPFQGMIESAENLKKTLKRGTFEDSQKAQSFFEKKQEEYEGLYATKTLEELKESLQVVEIEMRIIKENIEDCLAENNAREALKNERQNIE